MLATFGEFFEAAAKLPRDAWSSIGLGLGTLALAFFGVIASRKGAADKAAQPSNPVQPSGTANGGLTFLADSDTERSILDELRGLRRDQTERYDESERRRIAAIEEERHELKEQVTQLEARLRAGQVVTHTKQDDLGARIDDLMSVLRGIKS